MMVAAASETTMGTTARGPALPIPPQKRSGSKWRLAVPFHQTEPPPEGVSTSHHPI
jgi:hypothetical protein